MVEAQRDRKQNTTSPTHVIFRYTPTNVDKFSVEQKRNKALTFLEKVFPNEWESLDLGNPEVSAQLDETVPRRTFHRVVGDERDVQLLATMVCEAAAHNLSNYPNIGFWLQRLSGKDAERLPFDAFKDMFPETLGGILNAMSCGLVGKVNNPQTQLSFTKIILAHYLGASKFNELDPNQPLTGSLVSYMAALANGRDLRRLSTQAGGTSTSPVIGEQKVFPVNYVGGARASLNAYQDIMPNTPVVRIDHTDMKRERLRGDVLNIEAFTQQLPTQPTVHDFLSFTRAYWENRTVLHTPEISHAAMKVRVSNVHVFMSAIIDDLPPRWADLTDVYFADLEPIARAKGVDPGVFVSTELTFQAWQRFLDLGQEPKDFGNMLTIEPIGL